MVYVHKKEGETSSALLYRFSKRVKQSGILKESRKRRYHSRTVTKRSRRVSALQRATKRTVFQRSRKLGTQS